jgi:2',3'-cyclic-nucleotide 2'-phosphodiesterase
VITILFLGDVVARAGRNALKSHLPSLKQEFSADLTIVNAENASGGFGLEPSSADEIFKSGADVLTGGNHIWNKRDIGPYLDQKQGKIVRPANYPTAPGAGYSLVQIRNVQVAIINVIGRIFMPDPVDCPFSTVDQLLATTCQTAIIKFVDFHGEATSEKLAFAYYVDGRVSAFVGTHTHVQTADERILPKGTACISDVGMCGPHDSVIGVDPQSVIERFKTGRPARFETAKGATQINGVVIKVDPITGVAKEIERINRVYAGA